MTPSKLITICVVCLLFNFTTSAQTIPSNYFGMEIVSTDPTHWPSVNFGTIRIYDNGASWSSLNPSPGIYNWNPLDKWLSLAAAHGDSVLYTFGRTPVWAISGTCTGGYAPSGCSQPPVNISDWDNFVRAIATHAAGRIKYWEMWNEPSEAVSWTGSIAMLVTMTQHARAIIKSVDANALIISPGTDKNTGNATFCNQVLGVTCGSNWTSAYLAAGAKGYVDVIGFHGYLGPVPENIIDAIQLQKSAMAAVGVALPLWDTESSWEQDYVVTGASDRVAFVARKYLLERSFGVGRLYWNGWDSTLLGTLWSTTTGVQPAGNAYGQISKWLSGATLSSPCAMSADSTWVCVITRSGGYEGEIVWNGATTKSYIFPPQFRQLRTLAGGVSTLGGSSITITGTPVLLETTSPVPVALLSVSPTAGPAGLTVVADASASYDSAATIVGRTIIWGDGTYVNWVKKATHIYPKAGTYKVTLELTDRLGGKSQLTRTVAVDGGPTPILSVSTTSGSLTVTANSSKSYDYPGQFIGRSILWGDGTDTNWQPIASHTYRQAGTYVVTLQLTNNYGQKSHVSKTVSVQ